MMTRMTGGRYEIFRNVLKRRGTLLYRKYLYWDKAQHNFYYQYTENPAKTNFTAGSISS